LFKIREDEEESQSPVHARGFQSHYALLHLRVADDRAWFARSQRGSFGLKSGRHENVVEASTEELAAGQWLKITPTALPEGEFVVTRLPDNKKLFESMYTILASAPQPNSRRLMQFWLGPEESNQTNSPRGNAFKDGTTANSYIEILARNES